MSVKTCPLKGTPCASKMCAWWVDDDKLGIAGCSIEVIAWGLAKKRKR